MRNIKLLMEYDGSRYNGFAKGQTEGITIQDKIETVLSKMEGETITLIGAARTEKGVHAYGQIANFKTNSALKLYEIKHYLNRFLPEDIAVLEVSEVPEQFHSSFNATSFRYEYRIAMGEAAPVFERKYVYYCFHKLDIGKMKEAAKYFIGRQDLKAFTDNKRLKKSTERTIYEIDVYGDIKEVIVTIHADDFWPHMARIIVGTIMEAGLCHIEPEQVKTIIQKGNRELAGATMEAQGLFLQEVIYL